MKTITITETAFNEIFNHMIKSIPETLPNLGDNPSSEDLENYVRQAFLILKRRLEQSP